MKAREAKIAEIELLIPLARQLQAMKIDITNFLPWVETVHEYAVTRNTDLTTSAYNIADDLREFTAHKQQAVTTLMNLQNVGFSEKDINELIGLVTAWNKSGIAQIGGPGFGQGNGNNGSKNRLDTELIGVGH